MRELVCCLLHQVPLLKINLHCNACCCYSLMSQGKSSNLSAFIKRVCLQMCQFRQAVSPKNVSNSGLSFKQIYYSENIRPML